MRFAIFILGWLFSALSARACELALVLAVDVSGSVDSREYRVQMQGLADAMADSAVSEALVAAKARVLLLQWTGSSRQRISIPWTAVEDFETADALAARIAETPRVWRNFSTAIGEALLAAEVAFLDVAECKRHVVDVSGDGFSNEGIVPENVRQKLGASGIIINGLAIEESQPGLTEYFRENLIWGPGAFAVTADTFDDYPKRIRQKLLREITKQVSSLDVR